MKDVWSPYHDHIFHYTQYHLHCSYKRLYVICFYYRVGHICTKGTTENATLTLGILVCRLHLSLQSCHWKTHLACINRDELVE